MAGSRAGEGGTPIDERLRRRTGPHVDRAVSDGRVHLVVERADGREARAAKFKKGGVLVAVDGVATAWLLVHDLAVAKELDIRRAKDRLYDVEQSGRAGALEERRCTQKQTRDEGTRDDSPRSNPRQRSASRRV